MITPLRKYLFVFVSSISLLVISCKETHTEKPLSQQVRDARDKGLKDWAEFPIGGAVNIRKVLLDKKLDSIVQKNFNSLTATNDMKMYSIVRTDSIPNFTRVDSLVHYANTHGMRLFGHALVWHYGLPDWISKHTDLKGPRWTEAFLKKYIDTVVSRYKGKVVAWDVVNEAFDTKSGAYRKTFWYRTLGPQYIEKAFQYAHAADPDALLFYNDFGTEKYPGKIDSIVAMVHEFRGRDVPIHGIGLQMHLEMATSNEAIAESFIKAASTGLLVHVSELDIIFNTHNDENSSGRQKFEQLTAEMMEAQAEKFKQVALLYRKHVPEKQRFGMTFWDFTDRDTWIRDFFDLKEWPTVFDDDLEPKPGYYGFAEGLALPLQTK